MPKVDQDLLAYATLATVGGMSYRGSGSLLKIKEVRRLSGITKGQWKRMVYSVDGKWLGLRASEMAIKKLEVMRDHGGSEHLETLLKMVEAQMEVDDGTG